MSGEFGTGKTIFVLAIVVGCFAVLWPKIFYPMLTASITSPSSGRQEGMGPHARPERPPHLYPEMMHPALREKGRAMPQRTIDKQARPGPMPGVRPPMGGAGGIVPPPQTKGSGAMGIIMPLYTVGIVVFFVYTIMKVLFKKGQDDDKTPKLKDFGLDPEYRKYVFAEEYLDNTDISTKDQLRRQAREESRNRKKAQNEVPPDTKIAEGHLMDQGRMDTQGKKLGNWYLPEGFVSQDDVESDEEEYLLNCIGGTTVEESARETIKDRLFYGKNNKKDKKKRPPFIYEDINSEEDLQNIINMRQTEKDNEQRARMAATKQDLEDDEDDENISDLDYLYSDEFLQILRKGFRNYDSEGNLDAETLESLCFVARDHLREKYIENVVEKETKKFQHPFGKVSQPKDTQSSDDEEEAPEENISCQKDTRLDHSSDIRDNAVPSKLEGTTEDKPSFKDFERDDDLGITSEQEKDQSRDKADNVPAKGMRDIFPNDTAEEMEGKSECEKKDEQLDQLRRRLEETEKAMERLMCQMGSVTDKLTAAKITEVLSQAQAQAKILKEEVGEMTSEEDLTSSEALTTTMSEETSLPASLQRHLEEIQVEQSSNFSDLLKEMDQLQFEAVPHMEVALNGTLPQAEVTGAIDDTDMQEPPVTTLGGSVPANRTIIQLQALKDDGVTTEELEEALPESLPAASESKENYLTEEQPIVEDVEISELPEEKKETYQEEEKELQKETMSDPEMVIGEPPRPSGTSDTGENIELINEADAEEAVALPVPAFLEDAAKPTAELPVLLVREISSEGSSEATETGADISDLRSFAEENANKENAQNDIPAPQMIVAPPIMEVSVEKDEESESVCKGQGTQTSFAFSAPTPHIKSKEDSTQTEKEQEVAVLGMNTSFRHDEGGIETKGDSQGPVPSHQVTEILLDALLPSETQLLVKDSQVVGSSHGQDIEIEASEAGAIPCVVTSNVSLAFLGLEQRDDITPTPTNNSTLIADEDVPENKHQEVKDVPMIDENAPDTVCQEANETPKADKDLLDNVQQELKDTSIVDEGVPDDVHQEVRDTPQPESQVLETEKQELVPSPLASNTVTPVSELVVLPPEELPGMSQEAGSLSVKTEEADANKECTKASEHTSPSVPEKADPQPRNEVSDILEPENERQKSVLIPDRSIGVQPAEVLPRPSSPLPPRIPEDQEELEEQEEEQEEQEEELEEQEEEEKQQQQKEKEHEIVSQIQITPSLEAIAEAVAAATTRAALDVLATSKPETFFSPEEIQEIATKSTFLTEEIPTDQSPLSTDESSSATTVVAVGETDDAIVSNLPPQNDTETAASETSSQSSVVYVATISHSPSGSPSSTPEMELSGQAVEAALAEAALEEASNTSVVKPIMHEEPAVQEGPGATTVSPKNEDSPTSSKGSSPDMDEYEVITKEEDHTTTTTKVKKLKEGAETAKNEPKLSAATTQKVEDIRKEVEEEAENEEEEEEEEEIEEEVEFEEVPKKDSATKRPAVDTSAKTTPKSDAATEETSDDE